MVAFRARCDGGVQGVWVGGWGGGDHEVGGCCGVDGV